MTDTELIVVFNAESEIQALLYRELLEEAGIDVIERPMEAEWFEGVQLYGLHSQLLVRAEDADQARLLVAAYQQKVASGELTPRDATDESA